MSGPDAARIKRVGIDPMKDIHSLSSYYSTVQVEGIPLVMGTGQLDLENTTTKIPNDDSHTNRATNRATTSTLTSSPDDVSPWIDDGSSWTPRSNQDDHNMIHNDGEASSPLRGSEKDKGRSGGGSGGGGGGGSRKRRVGGRSNSSPPSPRSLARHARTRMSASGSRITPHSRLITMGRTSSQEKIKELEQLSHMPVRKKILSLYFCQILILFEPYCTVHLTHSFLNIVHFHG